MDKCWAQASRDTKHNRNPYATVGIAMHHDASAIPPTATDNRLRRPRLVYLHKHVLVYLCVSPRWKAHLLLRLAARCIFALQT
jgi:hypothetical protein